MCNINVVFRHSVGLFVRTGIASAGLTIVQHTCTRASGLGGSFHGLQSFNDQGRRHMVDWVDFCLLLPEIIPEIDANPVGGGGLGSVMVWSLKNEANLLLSLGS